MSLLVVGSVALDSVETPFGKRNEVLGGSATYFSISASFFTKVKLVAVVGRDFSGNYVRVLKSRGIDTEGLEKSKGLTFRWKGKYSQDMNTAHTIYTKLNVFQDFKPVLPNNYQDC
ncbi:MAG: sugar kinase, partial [Candidatus Omnitrophota bacterium]